MQPKGQDIYCLVDPQCYAIILPRGEVIRIDSNKITLTLVNKLQLHFSISYLPSKLREEEKKPMHLVFDKSGFTKAF